MRYLPQGIQTLIICNDEDAPEGVEKFLYGFAQTCAGCSMRRRCGLRQFIERHNGANAHIDQGRFRAAAIDDLTDDVKKIRLADVARQTIPTTFVPKETQPRPGGALFESEPRRVEDGQGSGLMTVEAGSWFCH